MTTRRPAIVHIAHSGVSPNTALTPAVFETVGAILESRRKLHQFSAPGSEPAASREFAELAGDLAVMAAADKRDDWRFNSMQFIGVFVWHMLGMPESDYPIVKARLKCWLITGRSSAAKPAC